MSELLRQIAADKQHAITKRDRKIEVLYARIKELETQVPVWVSVDERLPNHQNTVLVTNGEWTDIDYVYGDRWERRGITHWMSPPKIKQLEVDDEYRTTPLHGTKQPAGLSARDKHFWNKGRSFKPSGSWMGTIQREEELTALNEATRNAPPAEVQVCECEIKWRLFNFYYCSYCGGKIKVVDDE